MFFTLLLGLVPVVLVGALLDWDEFLLPPTLGEAGFTIWAIVVI